MLKIRIVGLPAESEQGAKLLGVVFDVLEYDGPKDRRRDSRLVLRHRRAAALYQLAVEYDAGPTAL